MAIPDSEVLEGEPCKKLSACLAMSAAAIQELRVSSDHDQNCAAAVVGTGIANDEMDVGQSQAKAATPHVDMIAHNGLRGFLSLHVCVYHCFYYSKFNLGDDVKVHLAGTVAMPWFFILSGFSLAVSYNAKHWALQPCCLELCPPLDGKQRFDASAFYWNRFARVMPVTYFVQLLSIPLHFLGRSLVLPQLLPLGLFNTAFPVSTWLATYPRNFCGPAWTVSTLVFFYIPFPKMLPSMQRMENHMRSVCILFVVQFLWGLLIDAVAIQFVDMKTAYWSVTAWPMSRLPVFVMGCLAGLECCCLSADAEEVAKSSSWPFWVDIGAAVYCIIIIGCLVLSITGQCLISEQISYWSQLLLPLIQVNVVVGLVFDKGQSFFHRFCCLKSMQFLGQISMSFYLIHMPVFDYFTCIVYGRVSWPGTQYEPLDFGPPAWGIPIVIVVALILAVLMERFVEAPLRARLKTSRVAVDMPTNGMPTNRTHLLGFAIDQATSQLPTLMCRSFGKKAQIESA